MKRYFLILCCILTASISAIAEGPTYKIENELKTRRISKGKVSNPDPVFLVNAKAEYMGLYFKAFMIDDLTDYNEAKNVNRYEPEKFEYTVGYALKLESIPLKLDLGYKYSDHQKDMQKGKDGVTKNEVFIKATADLLLHPGVKFQYDTDNGYFYVNPYISHDFNVAEDIKLKTELNLYWMNDKYNKHEFKVDDGAFMSLYGKAYLEFKFNSYVSFGPLVEAGYALDSRIRDAWEESSKNNAVNFLAGFKMDVKF